MANLRRLSAPCDKRGRPISAKAQQPRAAFITISSVLSLRDYRSEDLNELLRIDQHCFESGIAYSRAEMQRFLAVKGAKAFIAEAESQTAGFIIVHYVAKQNVGHIITIDVLPHFQRIKTGSALMGRGERWLIGKRVQAIFLEVAVDNDAAIRFYKKFGYSTLEILPRYYMNKTDGMLMGKRLDEAPAGDGSREMPRNQVK